MDTNQVSTTNIQSLTITSLSTGKSSSRSASPCRLLTTTTHSDQMSKERSDIDHTGQRARTHSPLTARRGRQLDRSGMDVAGDKLRNDYGGGSVDMLITQMSAPHLTTPSDFIMANEHYTGDGTALDDSRLSGNDDSVINQSFISTDETEGHIPSSYSTGNTNSTVVMDGSRPTPTTTTTTNQHNHHHQRSHSDQAVDRLTTKIACTKESIRKEQTARDDNVNEYLKLAANANKQQLQRIKAVFEKKNQKSAHSISQLQKKLENYNKRVKDIQVQQNQKLILLQQQQQSGHRQPREVLRDVGQGLKNVGGNIRDGITGLSGSVVSKPREFAHLIKNKFGSADNINHLSSTWYTDPDLNSLNLSATMDPQNASGQQHSQYHGTQTSNNSSGGPVTGQSNTLPSGGSGKMSNENDSECSSVTSDSIPLGTGKNQLGIHHYPVIMRSILSELQERREDCDKLREKLDRLEGVQKDFQDLTLALEGERYRAERLEEQINDLTELHQTEIENLKQGMADMEEKVQYQSDERLRDVNEVLENCQTRISKIEHMSQQYVTVEGIDNSNARAIVVKLINVVLTVLQVVLLLVATVAGIIMPFLKTRIRVLTTLSFILVAIFVIRQWPDVRDIGLHMVRHLKESLIIK